MTNDVRELVKKHNIHLKKSLGQNFLCDDRALTDIIKTADIEKKDVIIEVGAGTGNMTRLLAQRALAVAAVEIDKNLMPCLRENLSDCPNVLIINKDILKTDIKNEIIPQLLSHAGRIHDENIRIKMVANLPYYITTPVIMKFLEGNLQISSMVVMVQKEVAARMTANPGSKAYGALSIAVQYYSRPVRAFDVPPHCFLPRPDVDSTVMKLDIYKKPPVELLDTSLFFRIVKAAFEQRRKTLVNALNNCLDTRKSKEDIIKVMENIGVDKNIRGENLSITQFARLANLFYSKPE
jgi:16S rRNA (adenine1518-N6/adenine1519-N6)-dimethyltransferase